ncbi:Uncharacterized protein OBRU01_11266 [Operophtera brumata]|uniref:RNA polymerase II nuclear localization protein SLC7A6OS n=1 Tax=Operophtera brumata TaxID=104452 RepID=A0A0L7LC74_OPEBR|nr:Uncharacterized protein OBRU01_11266 [Operophtera brumata]
MLPLTVTQVFVGRGKYSFTRPPGGSKVMATSTVLRVKRRLEDNPQDALVLLCKRMKTDTDEISPSLFVFRGTVENQETPSVKKIVPKLDLKQQSTSKVKDLIQKLRNERKDHSIESRYEVVNCSRGLKDIETEEFDLVDLERKDDAEGDAQYAYDLIEHYETDLVLDRNGAASSSDEANDDDDDSNDEGNWRNEYPDSEASSINEEDIVKAMERVDIGKETEDAQRYGDAYASYKARVLRQQSALDARALFRPLTEQLYLLISGYKADSGDEGFYYGQDENTDQFREQYASDDEYSPD